MEAKSRVVSRSYIYDQSKTYIVVKRMMDVIVSLSLLCLLSPLMLYISQRIRRKEGKSIISRKWIVGKNQCRFVSYQFRTLSNPSRVIHQLPSSLMIDKWGEESVDACTKSCKSSVILTTTGHWLQKYHLSKLPQLWNVLKGDMSLIGPKPETKEIIDQYTDEQKKRLYVKPGMIGYAAVYGRLRQHENEQCQDELYYIRNRSIAMDIRILSYSIAQKIKMN